MGILSTAPGSQKKERKKKPDELLSSVVRETAIPAAVELLRSNTPFVFPSGTAWVMLVLQADAIGGLSKKHGRDEAKGSIIELINSDQIKTLATSDMLAEEVFGIIPTEGTLERMEEYSLLTKAGYSWAVVWQKPSGELLVDLVNDATFAQAKAVAGGVTSLREAVGDTAWSEHSGESDASESEAPAGATAAAGENTVAASDEDAGDELFDTASDPDGGDAESVDEPVFDEGGSDSPEFDDGPVDFDEPVEEPATEAPAVEADPAFDETGGYSEFDDDDYVETDETTESAVELPQDQDQVREIIARRFLSEDLDLQVRLDEFDATFAIGTPAVQIEVPEGATEWLGDQVAQLNRQANADLAQLRYAHEDELRALYVNLMSEHAEQVIRDVATDRDGSRYKSLKDGADKAHEERQSEKEQQIRARRAEIVADYEGQAKKMAEQAAIQAEIQYKERNRSKMEREQADAVAEIERIIEDSHSHDQQEILRVRRRDAQLKMQVGTTRIFQVLAERHREFLAEEEERLGLWKTEIQRIVDDNRKADIVRSEALAEQQRTFDEVAALRAEQEARIEAMHTEHENRIRRMEDELERDRNEAVTAMKARDESWQHSLNLEKEKTNSQSSRAKELAQQLAEADARANERYEARIQEILADRDSYANAMKHADAEHARSSKIMVLLMIALVLVGVGAGFIGGVGFAS